MWIGILSLVAHAFLYKKNVEIEQNTYQVPVQQMANNEQIQQPVQQVNFNQDINSKFCPKCGTKLNSNIDTCFMCGNKF